MVSLNFSKNNKGQVAFISVMIGVVLILLGLALAPSLKDIIQGDDVMGDNGLNCSNPDISNQDKAICTSVDSMLPTYIFVIFGLAIILFGRMMIRWEKLR